MISASFVVDSKLLYKRFQGNRLDAKYIFKCNALFARVL